MGAFGERLPLHGKLTTTTAFQSTSLMNKARNTQIFVNMLEIPVYAFRSKSKIIDVFSYYSMSKNSSNARKAVQY